MLWLLAADFVTAIHAACVTFVVVGFAAVLVGWAVRWRWVHNFYFRAIHLGVIVYVCGEAVTGTICPLTVWENALRVRGGEAGYSHDFIGYWLDWLIFYQAPAWVFTTAYVTFCAIVLLAFWFVPVQWSALGRARTYRILFLEIRDHELLQSADVGTASHIESGPKTSVRHLQHSPEPKTTSQLASSFQPNAFS